MCSEVGKQVTAGYCRMLFSEGVKVYKALHVSSQNPIIIHNPLTTFESLIIFILQNITSPLYNGLPNHPLQDLHP
jgi:hypothetical protein